MSFDLIIFDCDGVLVDSEPIVNRVFVEMLAELGYPLDYEVVLREFAGGSMAARLETFERRLGWSAPVRFAEEFSERLLEAMRGQLQAVPGVREALRELRGPWRVAPRPPSAP